MDFISDLKNLLSGYAIQTTRSSISVNNWVFALHYKFTSAILIIFSISVAINQFILDPIKCNELDRPLHGLDTLCWMCKSFSIPFIFSQKYGFQVHHGSEVFRSYYQWIYLVLFVQAITFYLPGHFWKTKEKGRIEKLIMGLDTPIMFEEAKHTKTKLVVNYLLSSMYHNRKYFTYFAVAEIWNFINVAGQVFLIDCLLGKVFTTYGLKVIPFCEWEFYERYDPMANVFPKMIRCTLQTMGAGDDIQRFETTCALPINDVSEKIYIFLWFWFFVLAILSGSALIFRFVVIISSPARFFVTKSRDAVCDAESLKTVIIKFGLGDWFVLDLLAKNMDPQNFKNIVHDLARKLDSGMKYQFDE